MDAPQGTFPLTYLYKFGEFYLNKDYYYTLSYFIDFLNCSSDI